MFSTIIKGCLVAAAVYGAYVFLGSNFSDTHKAAFGIGGMGITYLALGAAAMGFVGIKCLK